MKQAKIAVIGAGAVGSTVAYALLLRNIGSHIVMVDIDEQRCEGEILDLSDALPFSSASQVTRATNKEAGQADIIIICAGAAQKPGQTRMDLIETNKKVVTSVIEGMQPINKNAIVIMVTNPLDVLTLHVQQLVDLPKKQVFGSGTFLDTQRVRGYLSRKLNVAEESINAFVLGEHGDTQFVAWSEATIGGLPITEFAGVTQQVLQEAAEQARKKAYEIIKCKGATFFGIGACVSSICENIIFDQRRIMPLSCYLEKYDVCLSMPVVLGANGIEQRIDVALSEHEQQQLEKSIAQVTSA